MWEAIEVLQGSFPDHVDLAIHYFLFFVVAEKVSGVYTPTSVNSLTSPQYKFIVVCTCLYHLVFNSTSGKVASSSCFCFVKMILTKRNPVLDLSTVLHLCYLLSVIACQRSLLKFKRLVEELDGIITILAKIGTYSNCSC